LKIVGRPTFRVQTLLASYRIELVSWSLTSLFSTNMAISETSYRIDFELIPTVKMETRHPQRAHLATNLRRSVIIAELWRLEVARLGKSVQMFAFF